MRQAVSVAWIALIVGCKASSAPPSDPQSVNAPVQGRTSVYDDAIAKERLPVFIYYANETMPDSGQSLLWFLEEAQTATNLSASQKVALKSFADTWEKDRTSFTAKVDRDTQALRQAICSGSLKGKARLAIFRNSTADQISMVAQQRPNRTTWEDCDGSHPFDVSFIWNGIDHFYSQYFPMAHGEVFSKALETVKAKYPSDAHTYLLVTVSHGNAEKPVTSWDRDLGTLTAEQVWSLLLNADIKPVADRLTDGNPGDTGGLGSDPSDPGQLCSEASCTGPLNATSINERWKAEGIGITKQDYLRTLQRSGMEFPVLFMEACQSALDLDPAAAAIAAGGGIDQIGYLYGSDSNGLPYTTIDYEAMLSGATTSSDLIKRHKETLDKAVGR
jgi:hypothetical protein